MEGDISYFSRRAREEREAAMRTANPEARRAHRDLARRYADMLQAIASHETSNSFGQ